MRFQYGSDAQPDVEPLLYAIPGRYLIAPNLGRIDSELQRSECLLYFRPIGFSSGQSAVIQEEVHPYFDPGESAPRDGNCPSRTTFWEVPFAGKGKIQQLPRNYKIHKFANAQVPQ